MLRLAGILLPLTVACMAAAMALPGAASAASSLGCSNSSVGTSDLDWTAAILAGTNAHRTNMGLAPLVLDASLTTAATWKARDLARRNYFAHDDQPPAGSGESVRSPWDRLIDCGYDQPRSVRAENIAAGQQSGSAFVDAWLNSPGHRANIENSAVRYVGLATASSTTSTYGTYSVQIFSSLPGSASTSTTPAPTPTPIAPPTAPLTTSLTLDANAASYELCPPATAGVSYREDSASGAVAVTATASGCLRITPAAAGTGVVKYRAWSSAGISSAATTLTVTVNAPRRLDGTDTSPATPRTPPAAPDRVVATHATATISASRCRGRWSVNGWCYVLTASTAVVRPLGTGVAGARVYVTRRTVAGRSALVGVAITQTTGTATLSTRLKPPSVGTRAWLARNVNSVQLQFRGSATLLPASAVTSTRLR